MGTVEMKKILKDKIENLSNEEVEKVFIKIMETIENADTIKIDLNELAPGILNKYQELMKKLA